MIQQFHFCTYIQKNWKQDLKRYLYTHDYSSIIHNSLIVKAIQMSNKKTSTVWFHLYEVLRLVKIIETEFKMVVAGVSKRRE